MPFEQWLTLIDQDRFDRLLADPAALARAAQAYARGGSDAVDALPAEMDATDPVGDPIVDPEILPGTDLNDTHTAVVAEIEPEIPDTPGIDDRLDRDTYVQEQAAAAAVPVEVPVEVPVNAATAVAAGDGKPKNDTTPGPTQGEENWWANDDAPSDDYKNNGGDHWGGSDERDLYDDWFKGEIHTFDDATQKEMESAFMQGGTAGQARFNEAKRSGRQGKRNKVHEAELLLPGTDPPDEPQGTPASAGLPLDGGKGLTGERKPDATGLKPLGVGVLNQPVGANTFSKGYQKKAGVGTSTPLPASNPTWTPTQRISGWQTGKNMPELPAGAAKYRKGFRKK
jgi:hypothetical protein